MNVKQIEEVFQDEKFVESLIQLDTPQEVCDTLKEKGIDISVQDVESIHDLLIRYENNELTEQEKNLFEQYDAENGELSEEQLENVAGGFGVIFVVITCSIVVGLGLAQGGLLTHSLTRGRW